MKKSSAFLVLSSVFLIGVCIFTADVFYLYQQKFNLPSSAKSATAKELKVDFPNNLQSISNWTSSTIPNTGLRIAYPALQNKSKLILSVGQDGDYFRVGLKAKDWPKLLKSNDSNSLDEYCNYPAFSLKAIKRDVSIKTIYDAVAASAKTFSDYDKSYASEYGLYTSINGKDIFFYKFTEDNGYYFATVLLKNYVVNLAVDAYGPCVDRADSGDQTLDRYVSTKQVGGWFQFIDVLKGLTYQN